MAKGEVRYRLVLDSKDFSGGIKQAEKEFQGFLEQLSGGAGALGSIAGAMGPVGIAAAAAMGAATLAVGAFAKATIDGAVAAVNYAGEISDLSTKTGIASESLQVLRVAGLSVGVTMEEAATAIMKMQQAMVKAPEDFKQLGLSIEKLKDLAPEKQFETIGQAILKIEDPAQRTAATIHFFGKSGQEAMKLLSVSMDEAAQSAQRLGLVMDDSTRQALDDLGDSVSLLVDVWEHLWMNLGGAIAQTPAVREAIDAVTEALGELSRFIQQNDEAIQDLVAAAITPMANSLVQLIKGVTLIVNAMLEWKRVIDDVRNGLKGGWIEAAINALGGSLGGPKPLATGFVTVAPPKPQQGGGKPPGWIDPAKLAKDLRDQAAAAKAAAKAAQEYADALHRAMTIQIAPQTQEFNIVTGVIETVTEQVDDLTAALLRMEEGNPLERFFASAFEDAGKVADLLEDMDGLFDALGMSAESNTRKIVKGLADVARGVQQGAQAFAQFASGDILGGISSAIGAVTSLVSGFRNLFGGGPSPAEILAHDIRMMQTEFINAQGGLAELEIRAARAGVSLDAMWNARTVAEYEAAVYRINEAIGLHETAVEKTKEAMDRWGISIGQMGPQFAQQQLHEGFAEIFQDIQLLLAGGADLATILGSEMGPAIQTMVQQAQAAGVALPEFMRPYIQALIDAGLLLDANGEKITDISQLQFTESLEAGVQRLIDKIEELVNALLGIPPEVETLVKVKVEGEIPTQQQGGTQEPPPEPPIQAAEGFYSPALPEDAFFQLHKGERVEVTPADETPARNMRDSGGDTQVVVYIGGERLDGVIQRRINAGLIRVNA